MTKATGSDRKLPSGLTETQASTGSRLWLYEKGGQPAVKIRERVNASGSVSYRVTIPGSITGRRIKPVQKASLVEAVRFVEDELGRYRRHGQGKALNPTQNVDAIEAFKALSGTGLSLRWVAEHYRRLSDVCAKHGADMDRVFEVGVRTLYPAGGQRTVAQVVDEILALKTRATNLRERTSDTAAQLGRKVRDHFGDKNIGEVTKGDAVDWFLSLKLAPRTLMNRSNMLGEVMRYAKAQGYIDSNPLDSITVQEKHAVFGVDSEEDDGVNILTVAQADRLMRTAAESHYDPYGKARILGLAPTVALGLFCGLRTAEILRLDWKDIDLSKRSILVGADVSKKRRRRFVEISDVACSWLTQYRQSSGRVVEHSYKTDYTKRFRKLQRLAGFGLIDEDGKWHSKWKENWMRHSYATYHYMLTGSPEQAAIQLGHLRGTDVFVRHYRGLASKEDAVAYFSILPKQNAKIIPLSAS